MRDPWTLAPPRSRSRSLRSAVALLAASALLAAAASAQTERRTRPILDPVGEFVPIKPKVFKDLKYVEITDYDRVRATNTGKPWALVHMKEVSALEPLEFKLSSLWLDFSARDSKGVVYKFRGRFTRAGDLYSLGKTDDSVLQGHLATYLEEELLRQENLKFKFRTGE